MIKLSPIVKNLIPGLTEKGKIKIGRKGESRQSKSGGSYQLPQKLDHFIITTLERGSDNNFIIDKDIHKLLGDKPKEIPIKLLFDDITLNFNCRYTCYKGKQLWCTGDGENALRVNEKNSEGRVQVECPCVRQDQTYKGSDKCKINGCLSVIIDGANTVGGVYKFRTTGYNSTRGMLSSLSLIRSLTGGYLAGIPLKMMIHPKVCTNPIDMTSQTVYVVGVEFRGSIDDLYSKALTFAKSNAEYRARMASVEDDMKKLISVDASLSDEAADITEEFFIEEENQNETTQAEEDQKSACTVETEVLQNENIKTENNEEYTEQGPKKNITEKDIDTVLFFDEE